MSFLLDQSQMKKLIKAIEKRFPPVKNAVIRKDGIEKKYSSYSSAYSSLEKNVKSALESYSSENLPKNTWFASLFSMHIKKEEHGFRHNKLNACCQYAAGVNAHDFFYGEKFPAIYEGLYRCYYLEEEHGLCIGFMQIKTNGEAYLKTKLKKTEKLWYRGKFTLSQVKRVLTGVFKLDADYNIQFAFQTPFAQLDKKYLEGVYLGINPDLGIKPFVGFFIMELLQSGRHIDLDNEKYKPFSIFKKKDIIKKGEEKYMNILIGKQKGGFIEGSTDLLIRMGYAKWK